jgi:hypothetical protein
MKLSGEKSCISVTTNQKSNSIKENIISGGLLVSNPDLVGGKEVLIKEIFRLT